MFETHTQRDLKRKDKEIKNMMIDLNLFKTKFIAVLAQIEQMSNNMDTVNVEEVDLSNNAQKSFISTKNNYSLDIKTGGSQSK